MKKHIAIFTLIALLLFTPCLQAVDTYVDKAVKVIVNGSPVNTEVVIHNNRVYVPLRFMSDQLGAGVAWDKLFKIVTVNKKTAAINATAPRINTSGVILINGSDEFKAVINKSLALLQNKTPDKYQMVTSSIKSINEAVLGEIISNINASSGVCSFNFSGFNNYAKKYRFTDSEKQLLIAGTLVHEAYHANLNQRGIQDTANGISRLESEILAHAQERQTLKLLGAPQKLIDATVSVDWVIDTNYQGTLN